MTNKSLIFPPLSQIAQNIQLVILDRDGVINHDSPNYIKSPTEWIAIDGSLEAIATLNQEGLKVCVATNQSGIGHGYFNEATLLAMHKKMQQQLKTVQGHLNGIFFCPHTPDDDCDCRKPKTGLYQRAMHLLQMSPQQCLVVGDALRDLQAAQASATHAALVKTGKGEKTWQQHQHDLSIDVYRDLSHLTTSLLQYRHG